MERRHWRLPPDLPAAEAEMRIVLVSAGLRIAICRRLGLPDEEGTDEIAQGASRP